MFGIGHQRHHTHGDSDEHASEERDAPQTMSNPIDIHNRMNKADHREDTEKPFSNTRVWFR